MAMVIMLIIVTLCCCWCCVFLLLPSLLLCRLLAAYMKEQAARRNAEPAGRQALDALLMPLRRAHKVSPAQFRVFGVVYLASYPAPIIKVLIAYTFLFDSLFINFYMHACLRGLVYFKFILAIIHRSD